MKSKSFTRARMARTAIALLFGVLSGGCANTQIEKSWKSPEFSGRSFKKVLVIGMATRPDVRRLYEDAFVKQLEAVGAAGVASYALLPDAQMTDRAAIDRAVAQSGADAVLVTRLVKVTKQDVVVPPSPRLQEYVDSAWPGTYTPIVAGQTDIATLETKLFDAATAQPVWSATVQQFDAGNLQRAMADVSRTITKELAKQKLL
jgi:hypothetical protein